MNEHHFISRIGWLRAGVLGANDGIISTASLIVGIAATSLDKQTVILTGIAGLVAGALSMAAGEYVSVSSQADTEKADLAREISELKDMPEAELEELRQIYIGRGLTPELALEVAKQLTANNDLDAHARDELGMTSHTQAKPIQAALTSALSFGAGAALPLCVLWLSPQALITSLVSLSALVFLAALGTIGAMAGGAKITTSVLRVTFWGAIAMGVTAAIGHLFGTVA